MRKIILCLVLLTFMSSLAFAEVQTLGVFKQNTCVELKQLGAGFNSCNITSVLYPNSTQALSFSNMDKSGNEYNYTFCSTDSLGSYVVNGYCSDDDGDSVWAYDFEVTPSGIVPTTAQSGLSIGILISVLVLMFFFGWLSFKFMERDKTFVMGLFFFVMALLISIYGLYLGVVYSQDYLYSNVSEVQTGVFTAVLYGLTFFVFLGMIALTIMIIKTLKIRKEKKKYGESWDSESRSYKY